MRHRRTNRHGVLASGRVARGIGLAVGRGRCEHASPTHEQSHCGGVTQSVQRTDATKLISTRTREPIHGMSHNPAFAEGGEVSTPSAKRGKAWGQRPRRYDDRTPSVKWSRMRLFAASRAPPFTPRSDPAPKLRRAVRVLPEAPKLVLGLDVLILPRLKQHPQMRSSTPVNDNVTHVRLGAFRTPPRYVKRGAAQCHLGAPEPCEVNAEPDTDGPHELASARDGQSRPVRLTRFRIRCWAGSLSHRPR